jgi:hypothetical protein
MVKRQRMMHPSPSNLNIYVTTAANAEESSYAEYCPPDAGTLDTCLGMPSGDQNIATAR